MSRVMVSDDMNKCLGCFTCQRVCAGINHRSYSDIESAIKVRSLGGLSGKYFATHCFACSGKRSCVSVCPTGALSDRKGGGVLLNESKCIKCRKCEEACIVKAIHFAGENTTPIICKHCGICAKYCPHHCLRMEERADD